jgi:hypothetical protein
MRNAVAGNLNLRLCGIVAPAPYSLLSAKKNIPSFYSFLIVYFSSAK